MGFMSIAKRSRSRSSWAQEVFLRGLPEVEHVREPM